MFCLIGIHYHKSSGISGKWLNAWLLLNTVISLFMCCLKFPDWVRPKPSGWINHDMLLKGSFSSWHPPSAERWHSVQRLRHPDLYFGGGQWSVKALHSTKVMHFISATVNTSCWLWISLRFRYVPHKLNTPKACIYLSRCKTIGKHKGRSDISQQL